MTNESQYNKTIKPYIKGDGYSIWYNQICKTSEEGYTFYICCRLSVVRPSVCQADLNARSEKNHVHTNRNLNNTCFISCRGNKNLIAVNKNFTCQNIPSPEMKYFSHCGNFRRQCPNDLKFYIR